MANIVSRNAQGFVCTNQSLWGYPQGCDKFDRWNGDSGLYMPPCECGLSLGIQQLEKAGA